MEKLLENKSAVITGGARGIGKEIVKLFLENEAVVFIFDLDENEAKKTVEEFGNKFGRNKIFFKNVNVTSEDSVEKGTEEVFNEAGSIDILVNNAGITKDNLSLRMPVEDFKSVIDINLTGSFICSKSCAKYMIKKKEGRIINISSVIGIRGNVGQANYSASKAGLIGLTKTLAREFASRDINVNAVAPGYIETEMTKKINEKYKDKIIEMIPSRKLGTVSDVANAVLFLASGGSSYITGTVIVVDGGMSI